MVRRKQCDCSSVWFAYVTSKAKADDADFIHILAFQEPTEMPTLSYTSTLIIKFLII
jgi:hypothetical protein